MTSEDRSESASGKSPDRGADSGQEPRTKPKRARRHGAAYYAAPDGETRALRAAAYGMGSADIIDTRDDLAALKAKHAVVSSPKRAKDMETHAAVILAAGFSTRMGAFKPLLPLAGMSSLVAGAVTLFRKAGIERILVVAGHRGRDVEEEAESLWVSHVRNPHPEEGMFSSVKTGFHGVFDLWPETGWIFVLPVDIPLVDSATVFALRERSRELSSRLPKRRVEPYEIAVLPRHDGETGHPPMLSADAARRVLAYRGDGGLAAAMKAFPVECVDVADPHLDTDLDTPDDYRKAQAWMLERQREEEQREEAKANGRRRRTRGKDYLDDMYTYDGDVSDDAWRDTDPFGGDFGTTLLTGRDIELEFPELEHDDHHGDDDRASELDRMEESARRESGKK